MKLSVTVNYKTRFAKYSVIQEAAGVYLASLEVYEGPLSEAPPSRIMLVKGVRRWTGSFEQQDVLDDLGRAIDSNHDHHQAKNNFHENTSITHSDY